MDNCNIFCSLTKIIKFATMIENATLTEYRVKHISQEAVVHIEEGERAYTLETVYHGSCADNAEEQAMLKALSASPGTLGFELDIECDFEPYLLKTFNADKTINAEYCYGEHHVGGSRHPESCKFRSGEKVLCVIHEGYDAVFPGIVVGPLTEEYLRRLYETDFDMQTGYTSADEAVESWLDWNWDSVIVRPLVRLRNDWEEMGETVIVNRVYLFPYKKFEV